MSELPELPAGLIYLHITIPVARPATDEVRQAMEQAASDGALRALADLYREESR